jgi:hypothetical protein
MSILKQHLTKCITCVVFICFTWCKLHIPSKGSPGSVQVVSPAVGDSEAARADISDSEGDTVADPNFVPQKDSSYTEEDLSDTKDDSEWYVLYLHANAKLRIMILLYISLVKPKSVMDILSLEGRWVLYSYWHSGITLTVCTNNMSKI